MKTRPFSINLLLQELQLSFLNNKLLGFHIRFLLECIFRVSDLPGCNSWICNVITFVSAASSTDANICRCFSLNGPCFSDCSAGFLVTIVIYHSDNNYLFFLAAVSCLLLHHYGNTELSQPYYRFLKNPTRHTFTGQIISIKYFFWCWV